MRIGKRILKIVGWTLSVLLSLHLLVVLVLQMPAVQSYLTQKAVAFYESKTGTKAQIEEIDLYWFKTIHIGGLYLEEPNGDTLVYVGSLSTSIDLMPLLDNTISIGTIEVDDLRGNITQHLRDSSFNFDFIVEAFVTTETQVQEIPNQAGNEMDFSIDALSLSNIDVRYEDQTSGMKVDLDLEALEIDFSKFSLLNETIHMDVLRLAGTTLNYQQLQEAATIEEDSEEVPFPFDLALNELQLDRIQFNMKSTNDGYTNFYIGQLHCTPEKLDLAQQKLVIKELLLAESEASIYLPPSVATEEIAADSTTTSAETLPWNVGWVIDVAHLSIKKTGLDFATQKQSKTSNFNPDFIAVSDFNTEINDLKLDGSSIGLHILSGSAKERGGALLKSLEAELYASNTMAYAKNLHLELNNSQMDDDVELHYNNFNEWVTQPQSVAISANFKENHILPFDFKTFVPDLLDTTQWNGWAKYPISLRGRIDGKESHLDFSDFEVNAGAKTHMVMTGFLENIATTDSLRFALQVEQLSTTKSDVQLFTPADAIDSSTPIPGTIELSAEVSGNLENVDGRFQLKTSKGALKGDGFFKNTSSPSYMANLAATNLDLGFFTGNDSLGTATLQLKTKGSGLDLETMNAEAELKVKELNLIDYAYQSFNLQASVKHQVATVNTAYEDSNLVFDLFAKYDIKDTILDIDLDLRGIDFERLHLADSDVRTKFNLKAHTEGLNPNTLKGEVIIHDIGFRANDIEYYSDSLISGARTENGKRELYVHSDLFNLKVFGEFNLIQLPEALNAHFNRYFLTDSSANQNLALKQNFSYSIDLEKSDIISEILLPGLGEYEPGHIDGKFDGKNDLFELHLRVPQVIYGDLNLDTFKVDVNSNRELLAIDFSLLKGAYQEYSIQGLQVNAKAANNIIDANLQIADQKDLLKYDLSVKAYPDPDGVKIVLADKNVLNHETWLASKTNELVITNGLFKANNFRLSHESESISLQNVAEDNLAIGFQNFQLQSLLNVIDADTEIASGKVSGEVKLVSQNGEQKAFTANISIPDLSLFENEIGKLEVQADNKDDGAFALEGKISGFGNDVRIGGTYTPTPTTQLLDLTINLQPLNMSTIEALSLNQLKEASGRLKGAISIGGTIDEPKVYGKLTFDNTGFVVSYLGSRFKIDQQSIVMDNEGVLFNQFTVKDSADNPLKINGRMYTANYQDFRFDMNIHADQLTVLNTTNESEELYFGKVVIDADLHVTGSQLAPKVKMNATIKKGTELSARIPDTNPTVTEREGLIEFVDFSADTTAILARNKEKDTIKTSIRELDVTAIINIDEQMVFKVYLDEAAGDYLRLQGGGQMGLGIDPSGNLSLTGRYTVKTGIYQLSFYKLVKKKFDIQEGGYIQWFGDPLKATMNITASYEKNVDVNNLFVTQAAGSEGQNTQYGQRVPIRVNLNISDELMQPDIDFDIVLPPDDKGAYGGKVDAKLQEMNQTESEVNKQAFGLLVLGSFIPEQPGAASSTESTTRGSVSNVLTNQLNSLSDKYIKVVDLSVGVDSYEGTEGGNTELELGLSKQFLNDRMEVSVGTNTNLEGEGNTNTSGFVGDVSVQYKLTKDGAYKLKGYQQNEFDGLIEGVLVETGFALIFVKDFNETKDLFSHRKKPEKANIEMDGEEPEQTSQKKAEPSKEKGE